MGSAGYEAIPQGLKPQTIAVLNGSAEAEPFYGSYSRSPYFHGCYSHGCYSHGSYSRKTL